MGFLYKREDHWALWHHITHSNLKRSIESNDSALKNLSRVCKARIEILIQQINVTFPHLVHLGCAPIRNPRKYINLLSYY